MARRRGPNLGAHFTLGLPIAFGNVYENLAPVNTVVPAITGTVREGQTLTCGTGTWTDIESLTYSYQWKRDGSSIGGATAATRVLAAADIGAVMTCTVTANDGTLTANATSAGTIAVLPVAPVNTVVPAITGTVTEGQTLTSSTGTWTSTPTPTYTYQWKRDGTNISGATASTRVLAAADVGAVMTCAVTATNAGGNATATSAATSAVLPVAPANTVVPAITGTATIGQTLTSSTGAWTSTPTPTYTYQWKRAGSNISGATASTYVLVAADVGSTITVAVNASNAGGSNTANSTATATVALILDGLSASASGAYSATRKLRSAYAGSCLKVRRSSDNTTQDIGFNSDLTLDTAALLTFIGAGDGFVHTLFDQTTNARNLVQATTTLQPKIAASGAMTTTVNSKPSPTYTGTSTPTRLVSSGTVANHLTASAYSIFVSGRASQGDTNAVPYTGDDIYGDSGGYLWGNMKATSSEFKPGHWDGAAKTAAKSHGGYPITAVFHTKFSSGTIDAHVNGGAKSTASAGNISNTTGTVRIGAGYDTGIATNGFYGEILEFVTFGSAVSNADADLLGAALAAHIGQTWTAVS